MKADLFIIHPARAATDQKKTVAASRCGQVLVKVMAFGLNRRELMTRKGHSSGVVYSKVSGSRKIVVVNFSPIS